MPIKRTGLQPERNRPGVDAHENTSSHCIHLPVVTSHGWQIPANASDFHCPCKTYVSIELGIVFTLLTTTENISRSSFLCSCGVALLTNTTVGIQLVGPAKELVRKARVVRSEWHETPYPHYAFHFVEKPDHWVLD